LRFSAARGMLLGPPLPFSRSPWTAAAHRRYTADGDTEVLQKRRDPMIQQNSKPTVFRLVLVGVCLLCLAGCAGNIELGPDAVKGKVRDGTIEMHEVQAAYLASGSGGAGVLFFRGVEYPFDVGGAGVGGIGLSTIEATGEVYNLRDLGQFPGTYGQARYGF